MRRPSARFDIFNSSALVSVLANSLFFPLADSRLLILLADSHHDRVVQLAGRKVESIRRDRGDEIDFA